MEVQITQVALKMLIWEMKKKEKNPEKLPWQ